MKESLDTGYLSEKELFDIKCKENLWSEVFGNVEYKPDFSHSEFFREIARELNTQGYITECRSMSKSDNEKILQIVSKVKNNDYMIDITFLNGLDDDEKNLISFLFISKFGFKNLGKKQEMGKSLLLWMICWLNFSGYMQFNFFSYIEEIGKNFVDFNTLYFKQAFSFLSEHQDKEHISYNFENFLFDIMTEYCLLKNLDKDVELINKGNELNLLEDFCLKAFHAGHRNGCGHEIKYGSYGLDKNGVQTHMHETGKINMVDGDNNDIAGAYTLDRNDKSLYTLGENGDLEFVDASGIVYNEYLDAPSGIALFYNDEPVACMCFYIRNGNELFINQIQKVAYDEYNKYGICVGRHYSKNIENVDWRSILYKAIRILVKNYNISNIIIQGAKNNIRTRRFKKNYETSYFRNTYYKQSNHLDEINVDKEPEVRLKLEVAERIYDAFAKKLGFHPDDKGDWHKNVVMVHQSELLDYSGPEYNYRLLCQKNNFKIRPDKYYVIISTNENPVYRLKFSGFELQEILNRLDNNGDKSDFIEILFKDNKAFLVCGNKDVLDISSYLY